MKSTTGVQPQLISFTQVEFPRMCARSIGEGHEIFPPTIFASGAGCCRISDSIAHRERTDLSGAAGYSDCTVWSWRADGRDGTDRCRAHVADARAAAYCR